MLFTALLTTTLCLAASSSEAALLTELISTASARDTRFDVVTAADLRRITTLEGVRQSAGCEEDGACLAELASAVGARYVIFSSLGSLGKERVLTLQLYDSTTAQIKARHLERAAEVSGIVDAIDAIVAGTLAKVSIDGGATRPKLLILDVAAMVGESTDNKNTEPVAVSPWPAVLFTTAGVGVGLGAIGIVSSFFIDAAGDDPKRTLAESRGVYAARDAVFVGAVIVAGVGVVAAVAGGVAVAVE